MAYNFTFNNIFQHIPTLYVLLDTTVVSTVLIVVT